SGNVLLLTKTIEVVIITTALKKDLLTEYQITSVTDMMRTLNKHASRALQTFNPSAVTDITGFGLLGHAYEMAKGSGVSFEIDNKHVALLPGTKDLANKQVITASSRRNNA